ncbi:MAG: helix-turn-helix domain-containing protein, partial [Clostridia bacterium]|nr:helix-turn-helix domain-containing protein [Clostridia bacterium]
TAEVSGYFTPEEAAKLIKDIREWLSQCRDGHRLGDLINSIEYCFKLSDGQLGELIGVSSRLVCKVRHGRPSPFTLARFTEVFGTDGGAKEE